MKRLFGWLRSAVGYMWQRSNFTRACLINIFIVNACLCLLVMGVIGQKLGIIPDVSATETAEYRSTQTRIAILALTPSDTPTATNTLTPTYTPTFTTTPTMTYTPSKTFTPSITPTPSDTLTPTDTPTATNTATPTFTPSTTPTPTLTYTPSKTFTPSITPSPSDTPTPITPTMRPQMRYVTTERVNVRSCVGLNCEIVTQMDYRDSFETTGQREDSNGRTWYSFIHNNQTVWIAGWLTSTERPVVKSFPTQPPAAQPPAQQQPTQPPAQQPTEPPQPAWNCAGDRYDCNSFSSCAEMWSYWNACPGDPSNLDGNNDGEPCESRCG